jgi:hypothetical protein
MKPPSIAKVRIPILVALVVCEAGGLYHFLHQPNLFQFIVVCLAGNLLIAALLWRDVMRRARISYLEAITISLGFILVADFWKDAQHGYAMVWAFVLFVSVSIVLMKLYIVIQKRVTNQGGRA